MFVFLYLEEALYVFQYINEKGVNLFLPLT